MLAMLDWIGVRTTRAVKRLPISLLPVLVFLLIAVPEFAISEPLDSNDAVNKIVTKMAAKWPPNEGYSFLADVSDCFDTTSGISLPYALILRDLLSTSARRQGYPLLDGVNVSNDKTLTVTCRWQTSENSVQVTWISTPWSHGKRGKGLVASSAITLAHIPQKAFQADMDSWARTLVHRMIEGKKLDQVTVYLQPFNLTGGANDDFFREYFQRWFRRALVDSSLFEPLDASKKLYGLETTTLRKRGLRPVAKKGGSLTADLLDTHHEISGVVTSPNLSKAAARSVSFGRDPNQAGAAHSEETWDVKVALKKDNGEALSSASVSIPVAQLPKEFSTRLKSVKTSETPHKNAFDFELTTTRGEGVTTYQEGDIIKFLVRTMEPAYVYLFDLDAKGQATLLYPAFNTKDVKLEVGNLLILPDDGLPYELRVTPPFGVDTIWAVAVKKPLSFPRELPEAWSKIDTLRKRIRTQAGRLGSFAEAEVTISTKPSTSGK